MESRSGARGLAQSVSAALRRRQRGREPRVVVYDAAAQPAVVAPGTEPHERIVAIAERMLELAAPRPSP